MNEKEKRALAAYSSGTLTTLELRRWLNGATYGEILRLLSEAELPIPQAPVIDREQQIRIARASMGPKNIV